MQAVKLICPENGRFHFGLVGLDENSSLSQTSEILHSDTLFSAIVNLYAQTFGKAETDQLVLAFEQDEIRISSAYYCLDFSKIAWTQEENVPPSKLKETLKSIHFLPKPLTLGIDIEHVIDRKAWNKIAYISKMVWESGLTPEKDWEEECVIIGGKFLIHRSELPEGFSKEIKGIYETATAPKIADHIRKKQDNIYFQTDLTLHSTRLGKAKLKALGFPDDDLILIQAHFYFLLDTKWEQESESYKRLSFVLKEILPDEGIGGGISTGCGQILACEIEDFNISVPESKQYASMSLIAPSPQDQAVIRFGKTILRGGRVLGDRAREAKTGKRERLKMIRMITEGAILEENAIGSIPKLHDTRNHRRYGKAFPIPMHPNYTIHE